MKLKKVSLIIDRYFDRLKKKEPVCRFSTIGASCSLIVVTFLPNTPSVVRPFSGVLGFILLMVLGCATNIDLD